MFAEIVGCGAQPYLDNFQPATADIYVHSHRKVHSEQDNLTSELVNVFGPGLQIKVEDSSGNSGDPSQADVIALGVLLAISFVINVALVR